MPEEKGVVLLTGFEPFGSWKRNVAGEAVLALDGQERGGVVLRARVLPVAHPRAFSVLDQAIRETRPLAVAAFGIHGDPGGPFRVEGIARNEMDFGMRDNDGNVRKGSIEPGAPDREPPFNLDDLRTAVEAAGLPALLSFDAGRFLCNAVFYWLLANGSRACFVHVPPRVSGEPSEDVFAGVDAVASHVARLAR